MSKLQCKKLITNPWGQETAHLSRGPLSDASDNASINSEPRIGTGQLPSGEAGLSLPRDKVQLGKSFKNVDRYTRRRRRRRSSRSWIHRVLSTDAATTLHQKPLSQHLRPTRRKVSSGFCSRHFAAQFVNR